MEVMPGISSEEQIKIYYHYVFNAILVLIMVLCKCDVMGQNQSHVAKHKMAEICIFSENVKKCPFLFSSKKKLCKFLSIKLIFALFCYIFMHFSAFEELQLYMMKHSSFFKAIFLIILDSQRHDIDF